MKCEYCDEQQDGNFGSGRFCNQKCSSGFSTKKKRKEISKKVSDKMKGKKIPRVLTDESRRKMSLGAIKGTKSRQLNSKPLSERRWNGSTRKLIFKIKGKNCEQCGWNKKNPKTKTIPTQVHHKDGNKDNNSDANTKVLCPNCHSLTENFMFYGRKH